MYILIQLWLNYYQTLSPSSPTSFSLWNISSCQVLLLFLLSLNFRVIIVFIFGPIFFKFYNFTCSNNLLNSSVMHPLYLISYLMFRFIILLIFLNRKGSIFFFGSFFITLHLGFSILSLLGPLHLVKSDQVFSTFTLYLFIYYGRN